MEEWKVYKISYIGANQYTKKLRVRNIWEVSNEGNVRKNGILVNLSYKNGYEYEYYAVGCFYVHRAVAELFVPNPDPEHYNCVDHINGDTHDNRAENLRWCTFQMNLSFPLARKHNSESKKGKKREPFSEETKLKISKSNKGKKRSEEAKKHISDGHKGCVSPMKGKHHTEESKQKNRQSHLGKIPWNKGLKFKNI